MTVVSRQTADDVATVMQFFGIGDQNNRLFGLAADANGDAFAATMGALAGAIKGDQRYGANERVRQALADKGRADAIDGAGWLKSTQLVVEEKPKGERR